MDCRNSPVGGLEQREISSMRGWECSLAFFLVNSQTTRTLPLADSLVGTHPRGTQHTYPDTYSNGYSTPNLEVTQMSSTE